LIVFLVVRKKRIILARFWRILAQKGARERRAETPTGKLAILRKGAQEALGAGALRFVDR